jgi:hypothetical protein
MAINMISVGLSVIGSLRDPGRWLGDQPGLADVITRARPAGALAVPGER